MPEKVHSYPTQNKIAAPYRLLHIDPKNLVFRQWPGH